MHELQAKYTLTRVLQAAAVSVSILAEPRETQHISPLTHNMTGVWGL